MVTHCSIRESISSIPRTVIASGGWNEKLAESSETVRIYPKRGTTTGAFLTTGGHFIKNERIPAAQCAGTLSLHNLYLLQVPAKGWSCFCRKNLGTNTRPCVVPIIAPGISQNFTGEIPAKFFRKIYRRSPCCSWGVSALLKRFVLCEQQVSLCRTRRLCLDCCFFIDINLRLTIYVDYHRNLEYATIYC